MQQRAANLFLRWLRVPPDPQPPHGAAASLQVFRAGRNYLNLRLLKWGAAQLAALAGIIFWFGVFSDLEGKVEETRIRREQRPAAKAKPAPSAAPTPAPAATAAPAATPTVEAAVTTADTQPAAEPKPRQKKAKKEWKWGPLDSFYAWQQGVAGFLARLPKPAMLVIWFFEIAGVILYFVQLPLTLFVARLDYEQRWYMVTDRSLRIRHGVWNVSESTMSFANIQQVVVSQGPLQRFLGLADVKVQSAGGGSGHKEEELGDDDLHRGLFHSVTNASEIRDLILERLRHFRESGLGDPDEKSAGPRPTLSAPAPSASSSPGLLAATRELAEEVRALREVRQTLASGNSPHA